MSYKSDRWGFNVLAVYLLFAAILAAAPARATTFEMTKSHYWSQYQITKNDTVVVDTGATLTVDVGDLYGDAVCSAITVDGTLKFGTDAYNEPGILVVYGTLLNWGLITPATDTSFAASNYFQIDIVDGEFDNNGQFVPIVYKNNQTVMQQIGVSFSGNSSMSVAAETHFEDLSILGPTVLSGVVTTKRLYLYGKLQRMSASLVIDDGGTIYRDDSGSIAFPPVFNQYVNISYGTSGELVTGPELDSVVTDLTFSGDILLTKSVTVTGSVGTYAGSNSTRNYIHTGPYTLTLPENTVMNQLGVDGYLERIYSSTDSLLFPMIGEEEPIVVGGGFVPDSLGSYVARPIAIKLNNFKSGPDTITVSFHDTQMPPASLPAGVVALDRLHYWSVRASSNYAGNVDADVSLTWYHDVPPPGLSFKRDFVYARSKATVLRGNAFAGVWDTEDSSGGTSDQAYGAGYMVTGRSFKSFGDFTVGELAGVPNGDFEDWTVFGLSDWTTNNTYGEAFITKSPISYSGAAAIIGQTIAYTDTVLCPKLKLLVPTQEVPGALDGYFRFLPDGNDRFLVSVKAYKNSEVVAEGMFSDSGLVDSYKAFRANISPVAGKSDSLTDSLTIEVTLLPGDSAKFHGGTAFFVDDFSFGKFTAVSPRQQNVPSEFRLFQNYPNPFNPTTTILYDVPKKSHVTLLVYDVLGRKVATLVDGERSGGEYRVTFNGSRLASGVYFYRLKAGNYASVKKLLLLK